MILPHQPLRILALAIVSLGLLASPLGQASPKQNQPPRSPRSVVEQEALTALFMSSLSDFIRVHQAGTPASGQPTPSKPSTVSRPTYYTPQNYTPQDRIDPGEEEDPELESDSQPLLKRLRTIPPQNPMETDPFEFDEKLFWPEVLNADVITNASALTRRYGLVNLRNTCFANSIYQLLRVHPNMLKFLEQFPANSFGGALSTLLSQIGLSADSPTDAQGLDARPFREDALNRVFDYADLILRQRNQDRDNSFTPQGNDFLRRDQIDASEFLQFVFDQIQYDRHFERLHTFKILRFLNVDHQQYTTPLPYSVLPLELVKKNAGAPDSVVKSLPAAIQLFCESTQGSDRLYEIKQNGRPTGRREIANEQYVIAARNPKHLPPLIFTLNRFRSESISEAEARAGIVPKITKIHSEIKIPPVLNVPLMVGIPPSKNLMHRYHLRAAIVHLGETRSNGHYRAYTRPDGGAPFLGFDDSPNPLVEEINTAEKRGEMDRIINHSAYILLYAPD